MSLGDVGVLGALISAVGALGDADVLGAINDVGVHR